MIRENAGNQHFLLFPQLDAVYRIMTNIKSFFIQNGMKMQKVQLLQTSISNILSHCIRGRSVVYSNFEYYFSLVLWCLTSFSTLFHFIFMLPVQLSMLSFSPLLRKTLFSSPSTLSHITIVETMNSPEGEIIVINPSNVCWPSKRLNQRPLIVKFWTELHWTDRFSLKRSLFGN